LTLRISRANASILTMSNNAVTSRVEKNGTVPER
jgi:hypothetical protein